MWIDPITGQVARNYHEISKLRPNWSGPLDITDEMIKFLGLELVTEVKPKYDPATQSATELPPALVNGVWTQQWKIANYDSATAQANLANARFAAQSQIDAAVADRCAPSQRFIAEYQEREAQARAYVNDYGANLAAGSSLPVPARIAAFAKAAGMDPYQAAKLTVQQADALRAALGQLADLRMRKYEIKRATTTSEIESLCTSILQQIAAVPIP